MAQINFDFKQLQAFITVIETGSFTAAAEKLQQTQSSISQQIANLEKGLNSQLLDRSKRPVQLTLAGQDLYQFGDKLIQEAKILQDKIYAIEKGQISSLRLGVVDSIGQAIGHNVLEFLYPKVKRIFQMTGTAPALLEALIKGKINMALTMMHTDTPSSIQVHPLMIENYMMVSPQGWPYMSLEELCKQRDYIAYASSTPTGAQTLNWLKWQKLQPRIRFEIARADDILRLIGRGYGWTLSTPLFLIPAPSLISELRITELPPPGLTRKLVLICKDGEFSDFCNTFVSEIKKCLLMTSKTVAYSIYGHNEC